MSRSVFVIDDDHAVRDSLLALLRADGVRARGFAGGADFFAALPQDAAACVITDVGMPGMDGGELVRRLIELRGNAWPIIVITGHAAVAMAVQMMKSGIVDFIEKPFDPERLIEAVRACLNRMDDLDQRQQARQTAQMRLGRLTPRERQVFDALIAGLSNKEIGVTLSITEGTVTTHVHNALTKLGMDNRIQAAAYIVRAGLGTPRA